jgi:hypothetical protein
MNYSRRLQQILIAALPVAIVIAQLACVSSVPQSTSTPPGTPISLPETPPFQSDLEQIDAALKQSMQGSLAYNAPSTMQLGETITIQLLMSPSISPEGLAGHITEGGGVTTASVRVTPRMKAELVAADPDAFVIQALHDKPEQLLSSIESTEWRWNVTAKKSGKQKLTLAVYRPVNFDGEEQWRLISYERTIEVQVILWQILERVNWEWLLGIVFTGLLIPAIWRWVDKRKKKRAKRKA